MNWLFKLWAREPVVILELVKALITLGVSFGLRLTLQQMAAVYAVVSAVGAVIQRSQVTPGSRP